MKIRAGNGKTKYGPGIDIFLTGDEAATAIYSWLRAHNVVINGPRTVTINGELCKKCKIYVDPSGFVVDQFGEKISGRGECSKNCDNCNNSRCMDNV